MLIYQGTPNPSKYFLEHYGRKGMKWYEHIYGDESRDKVGAAGQARQLAQSKKTTQSILSKRSEADRLTQESKSDHISDEKRNELRSQAEELRRQSNNQIKAGGAGYDKLIKEYETGVRSLDFDMHNLSVYIGQLKQMEDLGAGGYSSDSVRLAYQTSQAMLEELENDEYVAGLDFILAEMEEEDEQRHNDVLKKREQTLKAQERAAQKKKNDESIARTLKRTEDRQRQAQQEYNKHKIRNDVIKKVNSAKKAVNKVINKAGNAVGKLTSQFNKLIKKK